jgi:S1-C subfamily serine protease
MYFDATEGVIIAETDPDSPARLAGFESRDRIIRVAGQPITAQTEEDLPGVRRRLGLLPTSEPAQIEVHRGGKTVTLSLTPREKGKVEGDELECKRWDLTVKTINEFDNKDLFFHRQKGVFIFGVKYPGNASNAGLRDQDILLKLDGKDVTTLDDVRTIHAEMLANVTQRHKMVVHVLRSGLTRQLVLDFSRDFEKR